jgi:hypothetical protein
LKAVSCSSPECHREVSPAIRATLQTYGRRSCFALLGITAIASCYPALRAISSAGSAAITNGNDEASGNRILPDRNGRSRLHDPPCEHPVFGRPLDDYPSANRLIRHLVPLDASAETLTIVGSMRTLLSIRRNGNRSADDPLPRVRLGKPNRTTRSLDRVIESEIIRRPSLFNHRSEIQELHDHSCAPFSREQVTQSGCCILISARWRLSSTPSV